MFQTRLDGKSLVKTVTEGVESPHEQLFWEYGGGQLAVRHDNWKLVLNGRETGQAGPGDPPDPNTPDYVHLADLESDPGERENLAEQKPELRNQLMRDLQSWADEVGAGN